MTDYTLRCRRKQLARLPPVLRELQLGFATEIDEWIRATTRQADLPPLLHFTVYRYDPGDWLGLHTDLRVDGSEDRAMTLSLAFPGGAGGDVIWCDGDPADAHGNHQFPYSVSGRFNQALLFPPSPRTLHMVNLSLSTKWVVQGVWGRPHVG